MNTKNKRAPLFALLAFCSIPLFLAYGQDQTVNGNLTVDGGIRAGHHVTHLEWKEFRESHTGYVKLVTGIRHNEGNMFSITIKGYRYAPPYDAMEIHCTGYAYTGSSVINKGYNISGTDLNVELSAEQRPEFGGDKVVVVRIGTPQSIWYFPNFTAEYVGWKKKYVSDFKWVIGETTPAAGGNGNNVVIRDETGRDSYFNAGKVGIGTTMPNRKFVVVSESASSENHVISDFTKAGNTLGSAIIRLSREEGSSEALDIELNSGGAGPFRYGTYADTALSTNHSYTHGPFGSIHFATNGEERLTIGGGTLAGNVGIGTTTPANELDVNGTIRAKEVIVETNWADYVFEDGYRLRSLSEVERHIADHGRLPGVPSAQEVAVSGVSIGDTQRLLLEKIEELTLHAIEKEKRVGALESRIEEKDALILELLERVKALEEK